MFNIAKFSYDSDYRKYVLKTVRFSEDDLLKNGECESVLTDSNFTVELFYELMDRTFKINLWDDNDRKIESYYSYDLINARKIFTRVLNHLGKKEMELIRKKMREGK